MRIFLVAYFVVPTQDLVPYAQRVVRVMGAAALDTVAGSMQQRFLKNGTLYADVALLDPHVSEVFHVS